MRLLQSCHQADFHSRQGLRDRALDLRCLRYLFEGSSVDARDLSVSLELDLCDRKAVANRAKVDGGHGMDSRWRMARSSQGRRDGHRKARRMGSRNQLFRICTRAVIKA